MTGQKPAMPPEHLRRLVRENERVLSRGSEKERRTYLGALKYLPHALLKVLEGMPMPWEQTRYVPVLYHVSGALTLPCESRQVIAPVFCAQWATCWLAMRREKRDRRHFRRLRLPPFDDEEPPTDYAALADLEPLPAVGLPLDAAEDAAVAAWLYDEQPLAGTDGVRGPRYARKPWRLTLPQLLALHRLAAPVLGEADANRAYLFDAPTLLAAKALNVAVPGGPRFEPPPQLVRRRGLDGVSFPADASGEAADDFGEPERVVVRQPVRTEWQLAYPFLYHSATAGVPLAVHHVPLSLVAGEAFDAALPPYAYGASLHPISFRGLYRFEPDAHDGESKEDLGLGDAGLPARFGRAGVESSLKHRPQLQETKLFTAQTGPALALFHAPAPFASRTGRLRRAVAVPVVKDWHHEHCPPGQPVKTRVSYQRLLKRDVKTALGAAKRGPPAGRPKRSLFRALKRTRFFQTTEVEWLEAALQVVRQGWTMLQLLLQRKKLSYLHLDYNFNLKPVRTLTTKERKRSRFGHAFHLLRELLRLLKLLVDAHVRCRQGALDAYQLADGVQYILAHVGQLTGAYRYKYRLMRQIRAAKDMKHVIYQRFNAGGVGKGPGCGFWLPAWRLWVSLLRGLTPLLERWLGNLLARHFEGRPARVVKTVSRQRVESQYDLELRAAVLHEVLDAMPPGVRQNKHRAVMQHLAEAWRCWKASVPWRVPGLPVPVRDLLLKYVRAKADWWVGGAVAARERLAAGTTVDKTAARKNVGRLTRLWMRAEGARQAAAVADGPAIGAADAVSLYTAAARWLQAQDRVGGPFAPIPFPPVGYRPETKLLVLALEGLREGYAAAGAGARLGAAAREELALIEAAYDAPHEALARIKRLLLTQRVFKEVGVELVDLYRELYPVYAVEPLERITDAWLDQYLWYEAEKRGLFPAWVKPADAEPAPLLVHRLCRVLGARGDLHGGDGASVVAAELPLARLSDRADLTLLNRLLRLVVDPALADYMSAKCNVALAFKDMTVRNAVGVVRGLAFAPFVLQYYALVSVDLPLLGPVRARALAAGGSSGLGCDADESAAAGHVVQLYVRYMDRAVIVLRFGAGDRARLVRQYRAAGEGDGVGVPLPHSRAWPAAQRMRQGAADVLLARAAHWQLAGRLCPALVSVPINECSFSVCSAENPQLHLSLCGFDVRLLPLSRLVDAAGGRAEGAEGAEDAEDLAPPTWTIANPQTHAQTARVYLRVAREGTERFAHRVRAILMGAGSTTFAKIAGKWNTAVLALVAYYREAIGGTRELLELLVRSEARVQTRIKAGLNSKMPARFPPVVFYTPKELGGLGMLSMGHVLIPAEDLRYGGSASGSTHFRAGMTHEEGATIPVLYRYIQSWEAEHADSQRVWAEYAAKRAEAARTGRRLTLEDLEDAWDRGVPRIATLFQRDRQTLAADRGWRLRQEARRFAAPRQNPFWWTHARHDGRLWALNAYRTDMIQALGGVEGILAHTLFRGTGFGSWEGLFWEKAAGFEETLAARRLTNAQRSGLSQIPNRRFTLWWSPTINRAAVYVGFQVQLDLTGVFMHGKIPTLKISLVQILRAHLWQKIHEGLVMDLCQVLDRALGDLGVEAVERQAVHPRKSYKMNSSAADIILTCAGQRWALSRPSLLADTRADGAGADAGTTSRLWIDVQLRWGDYDSHDVERYARAKYLDYTTDGVSLYPSAAGVVVAVDLAYGLVSAYGTFIPGLRGLLQAALGKIMRASPALHVLRERVRKALQLHVGNTNVTQLSAGNYGELFAAADGGTPGGTWLVDDGGVYRVTVHRTFEGNVATRPINGALVIVHPRTGQLYLKVVHTSAWAGQRRLGQLAKWKAAEEVAALVRSLPAEEQPREVVVARRGLLDPLEVHLLDYPNVALRGSGLSLPLSAGLLRHEGLAALVLGAAEPQMVLRGLYDDWLGRVSPYTAFSRLLLILRALAVDCAGARAVLWPDGFRQEGAFLWPALGDDAWAAVEVRLRDLVVAEYCRRQGVSSAALTASEVRDIILGQEPDRRTADIDESKGEGAVASVTETTDVHGQRTLTATTSAYETAAFAGRADWRQRMAAAAALPLRGGNIFVARADEGAASLVVPRALLRTLLGVCDVHAQVGVVLYGRRVVRKSDDALLFEVQAAVLPVQAGGARAVEAAPVGPFSGNAAAALAGMAPIGWLRTVAASAGGDARQLALSDAVQAVSVLGAGGDGPLFSIVAGLAAGSVSLASWALGRDLVAGIRAEFSRDSGDWRRRCEEPAAARQWAADSGASLSSAGAPRGAVLLTERTVPFWVVPVRGGGAWNAAFVGLPDGECGRWEVGAPLDYYAEAHRPAHFLSAAGASVAEGGFLSSASVLNTGHGEGDGLYDEVY